MKNIICAAAIILSLVLLPIPAGSQIATGGGFTLEQAVIAGGGGQDSTGSVDGTTYLLDGTVGQAAAGGPSSGGTFALTSGFWNFTPGPAVPTLEGDVAGRPNGDGSIQSNDVVQMRRFLNEVDTPSTEPNEFQRGDSAPRATQGNGLIDSADVIQTIRYLNEVDELQGAGGPATPSNPLNGESRTTAAESGDRAPAAKTNTARAAMLGAPELRVESTSAGAGQMVTVNIRADAVGNESQYGFALLFDPGLLSYTSFSAGTTGAGAFSCNLTPTAGRIRCDIGNFPTNNPSSSTPFIGEIPAGNDHVLIRVTFLIAPGAPAGLTFLNLASASASDDAANSIILMTTNGTLNILAPTAASVSVSGRLLTANGSGVTNATIVLQDSAGNSRSTNSASFGYFRFDNVAVGQTYIVSISSKSYSFSPQFVTVVDDVAGLEFIAEP